MHIIQLPLHQVCLTPQHVAKKHGNCMWKITLRQLWQSHVKKTSGQTFKHMQVLWYQWAKVHTSAENWLIAFALHTTPDLEKSLQSVLLYSTSQENSQNNNIDNQFWDHRRSTALITLWACILKDNNFSSVLRV